MQHLIRSSRLVPLFRSGWGHVVLRVFLGVVLVYGTADNVFSRARMLEFEHFLHAQGFPLAGFCAPLSVWAQFVCGLLFVLGFFTRAAALVMVVNFAVALAMVHTKTPFNANIAPLAMFFGSIFLLLDGPGRCSVDARRVRNPAD
jgi:putative oxidoreductase